MGQNPGIYHTTRELTVKLPLDVAAKLSTYRREMHPNLTDEEVGAYLIEDALIGLGVLPLPVEDRGKAAGKR